MQFEFVIYLVLQFSIWCFAIADIRNLKLFNLQFEFDVSELKAFSIWMQHMTIAMCTLNLVLYVNCIFSIYSGFMKIAIKNSKTCVSIFNLFDMKNSNYKLQLPQLQACATIRSMTCIAVINLSSMKNSNCNLQLQFEFDVSELKAFSFWM